MEHFDKINVGPVTRNGEGQVNIDFPAGNTSGVAIDIGPTPASANAKALIKLGDHYIGQNAAGNFSVVNAAGEETVIAYATATADGVAQRFLLAKTVPVVHMKIDTSVAALTALVTPSAVQADVNARANALKAAAIAHAASVGTYLVDGSHILAETTDAATLAAVPAATNLATSKTLTTALVAWIINHGDDISEDAHFLTDAAAGATTVTDSTPDDLDETALVLNELTVAFQEHFARGVA